MNTRPGEEHFARWIDGTLDAEGEALVREWALRSPGEFAEWERMERCGRDIARLLPSEEEPPYPDLFHARVRARIRAGTARRREGMPGRSRDWRGLLLPVAASVAVVASFFAGRGSRPQAGSALPLASVVADDGREFVREPVVYAPEVGVSAEWIESERADAVVIVLEGLEAIPDAVELRRTAMRNVERQSDSMAGGNHDPGSGQEVPR